MKVNSEYQGVGLSGSNLIVFFTIGEQGARRVHRVEVPIRELTMDEISYELHKAHAQRLREIWENAVTQDGLFD